MPQKPDDIVLLNNLLLACEQAQSSNPLIKELESKLTKYCTTLKSVIKNDWVKWIISENNELPSYAKQHFSVGQIQEAHELLRGQLVAYDTNVGGLFFKQFVDSQYAQDIYLKYMYNFHDMLWLLRHICPESSVTTLDRHYIQDPLYRRLFGISAILPNVAVDSRDDPIFFQNIVRSHKQNGPFPRIVSVIPDFMTLTQIVIAGEVNFQSPGFFAENQSAGSIFLMFYGQIEWLEQYNKSHELVYDLPLECLKFLLPNQVATEQLKHMFNMILEAGLLTPEKISYLMKKQVFTYEDYFNQFLDHERAASPEYEVDPENIHEKPDASTRTFNKKMDAITEVHPPRPPQGSFFAMPSNHSRCVRKKVDRSFHAHF